MWNQVYNPFGSSSPSFADTDGGGEFVRRRDGQDDQRTIDHGRLDRRQLIRT